MTSQLQRTSWFIHCDAACAELSKVSPVFFCLSLQPHVFQERIVVTLWFYTHVLPFKSTLSLMRLPWPYAEWNQSIDSRFLLPSGHLWLQSQTFSALFPTGSLKCTVMCTGSPLSFTVIVYALGISLILVRFDMLFYILATTDNIVWYATSPKHPEGQPCGTDRAEVERDPRRWPLIIHDLSSDTTATFLLSVFVVSVLWSEDGLSCSVQAWASWYKRYNWWPAYRTFVSTSLVSKKISPP